MSSKVDFVLKENVALKNKIISISNDLNVCLKKNEVLKNNIDAHVCHAPSSSHVACTSSLIENDICMLKKSVDYLGSTLSQCVVGHTRLESLFRKKQVPSIHAHPPRHTHAPHEPITPCMLMCTLVHIVDVRATLLNFALIEYMFQI